MNFWDRFVFRVCMGFGEQHYPWVSTAADVLEEAYRLRLLAVRELNDLSIVLIVLCCPVSSALHQAAAVEYLNPEHQLTPIRQWTVLREALPPRLTDLLLLAYFQEPRQRAIVARVVHTLYVPSLVRFLAAVALVDLPLAQGFGTPFVARALNSLGYDQIVEDEFLGHLYGLVAATPWQVAQAWPDPPPDWGKKGEGIERQFLICCLNSLDDASRYLLYLLFYAQLNATQIAQAFQASAPPPRPAEVLEWLRESWMKVLDCLARQGGVSR